MATEARRASDLLRGRTAAQIRLALVIKVTKLGKVNGCGTCDKCKGEFPYVLLEIDHVDGRLYVVNKMSPFTRAKNYWKEFLAGVRMRTLCRECNARDGAHRGWRKRRRVT
ncbi:MAG: hypothetical protein JWM74_3442 [Myxococcaceae bacterium]|nr:hypothetical protein [Myxococcaceae bacterium]